MLPRHLSAARHFHAAHFGYFAVIVIPLPVVAESGPGGTERTARYTPRFGRYEVMLARDEEETIILAVVLAVAELEL